MNGRTPHTCTVAGCRRPAVGFIHRRHAAGEAPEVYVGVSKRLDDLAICAVHLASVMGEREPATLLPRL